MQTFILLVFFHVGAMGDGNSNTTMVVPGFTSKAECQTAGREAESLVNGTVKVAKYICVAQTK